MASGGAEAKRAFDAMMTMKKIDVEAIEAVRRGYLWPIPMISRLGSAPEAP
jgi:hypothetical protein